MTAKADRPHTLVEEAEADPTLALELAAATGAVEGSALLSRVFDATGWTQRELAQRAQVTDGRVSQVLAGEENLRLSTVARYLHAMGYRLDVSATNRADGTVIDTRRRVSARRRPDRPRLFTWVEAGPITTTREHFATGEWVSEGTAIHQQFTAHVYPEDPARLLTPRSPAPVQSETEAVATS